MIELSAPSSKLAPSYLEFVSAMQAHGETIWSCHLPCEETLEQFVARLLRARVNPEAPLVPESTFWGTRGNQVVGRISLRHELNENLAEFGGHIGYEVHPEFRRQGIAKEMLRLILLTPKAREIGRLLLTCAPDNVASNKTIISNGGILTKTAFVERFKRQTNYYWITLDPAADPADFSK